MSNQYPNQPGYADPRQPGYGGQGGYAPQGGYSMQNGYPAQGGYQNQNGYPVQNGYAAPGGYNPQAGYTAPNPYPAQNGYSTPNGYPAQPAYPVQNGYTAQSSYPAANGYASGTGYTVQQPAAYGTPGAYAPNAGGMQTAQPSVTARQNIPVAPVQNGTPYPGPVNQPQAGQTPVQSGWGEPAQRQNPGWVQPGNNVPQNPAGTQQPGYGVPSAPGYGGYGNATNRPVGKKKNYAGIGVLAGSALAVLLLVLGIVLHLPVLNWLAAAAALCSCAAMWVFHGVSESNRLTLAVILAAVMLVSVVSAVSGGPASSQPGDPTSAPALGQPQTNNQPVDPGNSGVDPYGYGNNGVPESLGALNNVTVTEPPAETNLLAENDAVKQLQSFFYFWQGNHTDNMMNLCAPSWKASSKSPLTDFYSILANRKPLEWTVEKISGGDNDTSRTVTVKTTIDRQDGKAVRVYRLGVLMVKENETWYVDPKSLKTSEEIKEEETPEPTAVPTPEPVISDNTILYYNPKGGSKYHSDPNCRIVGDKFKPLAGSFRYSELNDPKYANLSFCNVCNAPARPVQ